MDAKEFDRLLDAAETPIAFTGNWKHEPDIDTEPITSSAVVLNPKSDKEGIIPLCPECREQITRVESGGRGDNGISVIEYRCGCEGLQRFEFDE